MQVCVCVSVFHKCYNRYENVRAILHQKSWELEKESRNICEWILYTPSHYHVWKTCTWTPSVISVKHYALFSDNEKMSLWWLTVVSRGREVSVSYPYVSGGTPEKPDSGDTKVWNLLTEVVNVYINSSMFSCSSVFRLLHS